MSEFRRVRDELQRTTSVIGPLSFTTTVSKNETRVPEILELFFRVGTIRGVLYPSSCYNLVLRIREGGSYFLAYASGLLSVLLSSPETDHLLPPLVSLYSDLGLLRRLDLSNEHLGIQGTAALVGVLWQKRVPELGLSSPDLLRFLGHLPSPVFEVLHPLGKLRSQNFFAPAFEKKDSPYPHPVSAPELYAQDFPGLQKILLELPKVEKMGYVVRVQYSSDTGSTSRFVTLSFRSLALSELTEDERSLLGRISEEVPGVSLLPYEEKRRRV